RKGLIEPIIQQYLGKTLSVIEKEIDENLQPQTKILADWTMTAKTDVQVKFTEVKNVVGVLEGEGPLAKETVVVGAHYDHLGLGGLTAGSLAPWTTAIHNGADDNGSGTVAMLEIAHHFATASQKPRRR